METIDWRCSTLPLVASSAALESPSPLRKQTAPEGWAKAKKMLYSFHLEPPDPRENFQLERAVLQRAAIAADLRQPLPSSGLTLVRMMANRRIPQLHQRSIAKMCPSGVTGFDVVHRLAFRHEVKPNSSWVATPEPISEPQDRSVATAALRCRPFSQCGVVSLQPVQGANWFTVPPKPKSSIHEVPVAEDPFEGTTCSFYHESPRDGPPTRERTSGFQDSQFNDTQHSWKTASMRREQLLQKIQEVKKDVHPLPRFALCEATKRALRGQRSDDRLTASRGELVPAQPFNESIGSDEGVPFFISQRDEAAFDRTNAQTTLAKSQKQQSVSPAPRTRRKVRVWRRTSFDPVEQGRKQRRLKEMEKKVSPRLLSLYHIPERRPPPHQHLKSYQQYMLETRKGAELLEDIHAASRQIHLPVFRHSKGFV